MSIYYSKFHVNVTKINFNMFMYMYMFLVCHDSLALSTHNQNACHGFIFSQELKKVYSYYKRISDLYLNVAFIYYNTIIKQRTVKEN